jgi:hypothetical protein
MKISNLALNSSKPILSAIAGNVCCLFKTKIFLSAYFSIVTLAAAAQCIVPPAALTCPIAGSIPVTNGMTLTSGNTYTASGTVNIASLTISGGTLVVCGTMSVTSSFAFNSGNIYVAPGGVLNVNHSTAVVFGANCNLYNYGSVTFQVSIVTGSNNQFFNCAIGSFFNIPFNQMVIQGPNTYFLNNGTFNSSFFIVQSNNAANVVCSGPGSVISTGIMINQLANAFNSPNGPSCVQITNQIINSQPMTNSPNVNICYMSGSVSVVSGPNFGAATVNSACPTCSVALPVAVTSPSAVCFDAKLRVSWTVENEPSCAVYVVQRSGDGLNFDDAAEVQCIGSGSQAEYEVELPANISGKEEYVRLKRTETNGNFSLFDAVTVNCEPGFSVNIYPTMVTGSFINVNADQRIESITMFSMDGKEVQRFPIGGDAKEAVLELGHDIAIGQYMLTVTTEHTRVDKLLRIVR